MSAPSIVYLVPPGKIRCYLTERLRNDTPEENVRQRWLHSLVEEYGYPKADLDVDVAIAMGRARKRTGIAIYRHRADRIQENIRVIVEVKRDDVLPSDGRNGIDQLKSYMAASVSCRHGLWVGKERAAFERAADGGFDEAPDIPRFGSETPAAPAHGDLKPAHELKSIFRRCHNYIYANAGLQKAEAFREFLKLVFCKTYDEEESGDRLRFSVGSAERRNESGQRRLLEERLDPLFGDVRSRYPYIFEDNETIRLEPRVAAYLVSELQFLSLIDTDTDVKGDAYEELVGANLRGDRGEFFTPRNVCDMAALMAMSLYPPDRLTSLKVVDCCCGTGGFLVSWLNNLYRTLFDQEIARGRRQPEATARNRLRDVCSRNMFGIDVNPFLVQTCQMNLVLHGDGSSNVYRADSTKLPGEWDDKTRDNVPHGKCDIVLTNPPFGGGGKIDDAHVLAQYELPAWDRRSPRSAMPAEELFIEAAMRFLKPGGHLAIVLPRGILNNPGKRQIRSWLLKRSQAIAVVDLPTTTFAASKGINHPSLLIARKFGEDEQRQADANRLRTAYEVFMSRPETAGIDRRAKPIFLRHPDGREQHDESGQRIKDDQVATVAAEFRKWIASGPARPRGSAGG